ncbi:hypothetical protein ABKV19_008253 [Rosa sericea]
MKLFFWKALNKAVPTLFNLYRRKLALSPFCPICGEYEETIEHTLLLCPWVEPIWFGSPLGLKIDRQRITTLDVWLTCMAYSYNSLVERNWVLTFISFISWAIWKARCCFVYQQCQPSPTMLVRTSSESAREFISVSTTTKTKPPIDAPKKWIPLNTGVFAVNCDTAWQNPNLGGLGIIIWDHNGSLVGGEAIFSCSSLVEMAEARAVLHGLNLAIDMNMKNVRIQSDSLNLIVDLNSNGKYLNWRTSQIIDEINWRKSFVDQVDWEWIPWEANRAAHEAALLGSRTLGLCRWAETPPPSLTLVLRNDGLPCPHM